MLFPDLAEFDPHGLVSESFDATLHPHVSGEKTISGDSHPIVPTDGRRERAPAGPLRRRPAAVAWQGVRGLQSPLCAAPRCRHGATGRCGEATKLFVHQEKC